MSNFNITDEQINEAFNWRSYFAQQGSLSKPDIDIRRKEFINGAKWAIAMCEALLRN